MYAAVELVGSKAHVIILLPNGEHSITGVESVSEAYTIIAQMGSEGWEMTGAEQEIATQLFTSQTNTQVRRLWFKKPLEA